jgi:hypothetical protein
MRQTISANEFIERWRGISLTERAACQSHFIDICALIGHATPVELDPDGLFFTFEKGAAKSTGGDGWADVWFRGHFAWEYKGQKANLDKAYQQLLTYRESLENPPLLIVCDLDKIVIRTNYTNTPTRTYEISLDNLHEPATLAILQNAFTNPEALKPEITTASVTEEAAARFSELAERLRSRGCVPEEVAHFLIRLVFTLFAEDVGILPRNLLLDIATTTRLRPEAFAASIKDLFGKMATGGWFGRDEIRHIDGHLFDDDRMIPLEPEEIRIVQQVSRLDWGALSPAIFGTLFERSLDPAKRAQLGAHYTSEADILLIVGPVVIRPLLQRWAGVRAEAEALAAQRDAATGQKRKNLHDALRSLLMAFSSEIAAVQVLDPACGSGNFLYLALRELLDVEKQVTNLAGQIGVGSFFPSVSPAQLHGIELSEYAYQLAQVTIQIGYLQWLATNGFGLPSDPILKPLDGILHMDAVLQVRDGAPIEPEWPAADFIIGNPPFLGDKRMRTELGDRYVDDLRRLYEGRVPGGADLVTYWFEKARAMIENGKAKRAGLLSTNSIRTGANRQVLDRIKSTGDIFMAWSDRPWILDGAAVRVSMAGFDKGSDACRMLDGEKVSRINADLSSHVDVTMAARLPENGNICFLGMMKAGPFDIEASLARKMLVQPINPNGRPNSDVVKRRLGGQDVTDRPRDAWVIDFGLMNADQASFYEMPFEYVRRVVKPIRDVNRRESTRTRWWRFGEARPGLRAAIPGLRRCLVTPEVAKHRIFIWMDTAVVPDHKLHVFARDDDYFFGVLQSRVHEVWSLAMCSWMGVGNDPSYSSTRTFETFPLPWSLGTEPLIDPCYQAIAVAAHKLNVLREAWLNPPDCSQESLRERTMTNLYNGRPAWLANAHAELDRAVLAAYGWPDEISDDEILERLLALNRQRSGQ